MSHRCYVIVPVEPDDGSHEWLRPETGERKLMGQWEPGAMWYAPWCLVGDYPHGLSVHWQALLPEERAKGPLIVKTPGGHWCVDRPSTGGDGWKRVGVPPILTVTPSIFHDPPSGWHGWMRSGELVKC